jgi:hypothetical protein
MTVANEPAFGGAATQSIPERYGWRVDIPFADPESLMSFVSDPNNHNRAFDPENDWELTKYTRDVPMGESQYYFRIAGVNFRVITKRTICEDEKSFRFDADVGALETSFRSSKPTAIIFDDEHRFFCDVVLPALSDAIICLETRRLITPGLAQQGGAVAVSFHGQVDAGHGRFPAN